MDKINEIYNALLDAWTRTPIAEQRPIDLALNNIIYELERKSNEVVAMEREFERFESFKHDQSKLDNVLSLLKICEKLNIKYDKDIDLNECDIDNMQQTINTMIMGQIIAKRKFRQAKIDMKTLWCSVNHNEFKTGDDYVFPNSLLSVKDIRKVIPYFDIDME